MKTQTGYLVILTLFFFYFLTFGAVPFFKQELEKIWKKSEGIEAIQENIISVELKVFGFQKAWKVEGFANIHDNPNQSQGCKCQFSTNQTQSECKEK
jgi:hypothetical protein